MTNLILKQDGIIYVFDMPEEPKSESYSGRKVNDAIDAYSNAHKFWQEFQSRISSAVRCEDQEKARELLERYAVIKGPGWIDTPFPIPGLRFEVWEVPAETSGIDGSGPPYAKVDFEKVAVLHEEPAEEEHQVPTCGECGGILTLVRPGSYQCDNPKCKQNEITPDFKAMVKENFFGLSENEIDWTAQGIKWLWVSKYKPLLDSDARLQRKLADIKRNEKWNEVLGESQEEQEQMLRDLIEDYIDSKGNGKSIDLYIKEELKKFIITKTNEEPVEKKENSFKLKVPSELAKMTTDELYNYIDRLHGIVRDYQIVINQAISKNQNL